MRSRIALLLPATAMALTSVAAIASAMPASAAGSGLELVAQQSPTDSTGAKSVTATFNTSLEVEVQVYS